MQKFEVGEMYNVGRPGKICFSLRIWLFIRCDDFKRD